MNDLASIDFPFFNKDCNYQIFGTLWKHILTAQFDYALPDASYTLKTFQIFVIVI